MIKVLFLKGNLNTYHDVDIQNVLFCLFLRKKCFVVRKWQKIETKIYAVRLTAFRCMVNYLPHLKVVDCQKGKGHLL